MKVLFDSQLNPHPTDMSWHNDRVLRAGMRTLYTGLGGDATKFDLSDDPYSNVYDHGKDCQRNGMSVYFNLFWESPTRRFYPSLKLFCCFYWLLTEEKSVKPRLARYGKAFFNGVARGDHTFYDND